MLTSFSEEVLWLDNAHTENSVKINESTFAVLAPQLPYTFVRETVNTPRAFKLMANDQKVVCRGNLIKTRERDSQFAMTSLPQLVFPGLRMYSHIKPTSDEPVNLRQLINQRDVLLGVVNGRQYDDILESAPSDTKANVYRLHAQDNSESMIELFVKRRVDVILEYPMVFKSYTRDVQETFKSYAVQGVSEYSLGYIACTNSARGKQVAEQFDQAIRTLSQTEAYWQAQTKWFQDFSLTPYYNQVYKTNF